LELEVTKGRNAAEDGPFVARQLYANASTSVEEEESVRSLLRVFSATMPQHLDLLGSAFGGFLAM
jgi:hypothetical protein